MLSMCPGWNCTVADCSPRRRHKCFTAELPRSYFHPPITMANILGIVIDVKNVLKKKKNSCSPRSTRWLQRKATDRYTRLAHEEGFVARAAYKLQQILQSNRRIRAKTIVDLGYVSVSQNSLKALFSTQKCSILYVASKYSLPNIPPTCPERRQEAGLKLP